MKKILLCLAVASIILVSCGTAKIQQPEYREIRQVKLIELGLLQSTAGIDVVYYNPNNFSVQLADAHGDVYVDNAFFGKFELNDKVQVGKKSEFVVPAIIKLDMIGAIKNQRDLFQKKEALVRIEGTAKVKRAGISREVPLRYEGMQNIERFRVLVTSH
jgi:LEA14-like dessication related protein